jgi:hypothetical protein
VAELNPFLANIILLVITAILTGLLVPFINARMSEQRARREQSDAEHRARQTSVLKSQEEFLLHVEKTLFDFHICAAAVPWYRSTQPDDRKFAAARDAYDSASWKFMAEMHAALSKARRLSSPSAYQALESHHHRWYAVDGAIVKLINQESATVEDWFELLHSVNGQAMDAGHVLSVLATDYGLVPQRQQHA